MVHSINMGEYSWLTHSGSCPKQHQTGLPSNTVTVKFQYFLEKLILCQFLVTDQGLEQQYWQYTEDLGPEDSTMPDSDLYLDKNTCSLTAFALFPSVLFHFILFSWKSENNFNTSSGKMANAHILQLKHKPHFELPENSVPRLCKVLYRNRHYGSETYTCDTEHPELGIFRTGKQTKK